MNCKEVRPLLSAKLDGEIAGETCQAVSNHLSTCEPCRREFESLLVLKQATARMPLPRPPGSLESAIRDTLAHQPQPSSIRRLALAMTAAAAITVTLFIGVRPQPSEDGREFLEAVALVHQNVEQQKVKT